MKKLKREITVLEKLSICILEKPPQTTVWNKKKGVNISGRNFAEYDTFAQLLVVIGC